MGNTHKKILSFIKAFLSILILFVISGCAANNSILKIEDETFSVKMLKGKKIGVVQAQVIENDVTKESKNPRLKIDDDEEAANLRKDSQILIVGKLNKAGAGFAAEVIDKINQPGENYNGNVFPVKNVDGVYRVVMDSSFKLPDGVRKSYDYILIPVTILVNNVTDINTQSKSVDLIDPGIGVSVNYCIYDVKRGNIVATGLVQGTVDKSGTIDKSIGRNAVLLALDKAGSELAAILAD